MFVPKAKLRKINYFHLETHGLKQSDQLMSFVVILFDLISIQVKVYESKVKLKVCMQTRSNMVEYENIEELYSSRICKCSKNNYKHFLIDPSFRPLFLPLDLCESCMKITKLCEFLFVLLLLLLLIFLG